MSTLRASVVALMAVAALWPALLAPARPAFAAGFTVTTTADTIDASPGNGVCADSGGNCSLRAAVMEASALAGPSTITVPAGTYTLTLAAPGESTNIGTGGDLDVMRPLTVVGAGPGSTIIQAAPSANDRLFDVFISAPQNGPFALSGLTLRSGKSAFPGGAIRVNASGGPSTFTLDNVEVTGNSGGTGGGITVDNTSTSTTISDSTISNNTSSSNGGGLAVFGPLTMSGSTLSGNQASQLAGGLLNQATSSITNSTISGNSAKSDGGAIRNSSSVLTLNNVTIANNAADSDANGSGNGGGIAVFSGQIAMRNTILANNSDPGGQGPDCSGSVLSQGYNLFGTVTGCLFVNGSTQVGNIVGQDPKLDGLASNGGRTQTHGLQGSSPAIDAGFPDGGSTACAATDQRGQARPLDGNGDGTARCDIGAYEYVAPNTAPTAAGDSYTTSEDVPLAVAGPGVLGNDTDAEHDPLTATLVSGTTHGALALNPDGSFSYTPASNYNGSDSFTYKANDGSLDSNTVAVSLTINAVNDPPVVTAAADQAVDEGAAGSFDLGAFADADDGASGPWAVDVDWGDGSSHTAFSATATGVLGTRNHTYVASGHRTTTVTVTDVQGAAGAASFAVTVNAVNHPPSADAGGPYAVQEGGSVGLSGSGTDPDEDALIYAWDLDHDGNFEASGQAPTFSAATLDGPGSTVVALKVCDPDGACATESATIDVTNVAPAATLHAPATVDEGSPIGLSLSDPRDATTDLPTLQYAFDCGDGAGYGPFAAAASASCPTTDDGTRTVRATVKDKDGGETEYTASVAVANVAPAVGKPADQEADEGAAKSFSLGSFADPGSDAPWAVRIDWGDGSAATSFTLSQPGSLGTREHTYATAEARAVTVTVTDKDGAAGAAGFGVTVNAVNHPPAADAGGPYDVQEGGSVGLSGSGTDPDGDALSYAWDLDHNGSFETSGQTATFEAGGLNGPSSHVVGLRVCDPANACATANAAVEVANVAPTTNITGAHSGGLEGTAIILGSAVSDPGAADTAAGFTYAWSVTRNGSPVGSGTGASFSFTPSDDGSFVVTLSARDKDGGVGTDSVTIDVTNVAPTATFSAPPSANTGIPFALALTAPTDPSSADTAAGFSYAFDCGSGYGGFGASPNASCTATAAGSLSVGGKIRDKDGGQTEYHATAVVASGYAFSGFLPPVDNPPVLNVAKAGAGIPVKFSLGGDQGLNILAAGYPRSVQVACDTQAPIDVIEQTTTSNSGLTYDPSTGQYTYVWRTDKTWAGTCRQLTLRLSDGSTHVANFGFK